MEDKRDIQALSKRFAELAGIEWHETSCDWQGCWTCECGFQTSDPFKIIDGEHASNPNFRDAREVLRVMKHACNFQSFLDYLYGDGWKPEKMGMISVDYVLDTTGLLLAEAVEFMGGEEGKK